MAARAAYALYSWGIGLDYSTLAANNFTVALQGGDAAQCAAHGLGCIAPALPTTAGDDNHSSMWGYNVGDEPGQYQFPQFAEQFRTIRRLRPGSFGFANLLQSYCPSGSLAANPPAPANATGVNMSLAYRDYVDSFATVVQPDILCTDYYPYFEHQNLFPMYNRLDAVTSGRGTPSMENYLENMMVLRDAAQRHNLTWWNYFGAAAFQGHTMVSEVQMKIQMMASITLGARGLLYWVLGKGDPHGWAGSIGGKGPPLGTSQAAEQPHRGTWSYADAVTIADSRAHCEKRVSRGWAWEVASPPGAGDAGLLRYDVQRYHQRWRQQYEQEPDVYGQLSLCDLPRHPLVSNTADGSCHHNANGGTDRILHRRVR